MASDEARCAEARKLDRIDAAFKAGDLDAPTPTDAAGYRERARHVAAHGYTAVIQANTNR